MGHHDNKICPKEQADKQTKLINAVDEQPKNTMPALTPSSGKGTKAHTVTYTHTYIHNVGFF